MDAARPMKKGELIEQFTKTFGIEVEFCTHNSAILSYTHIEVCKIKHRGHEWKIETDSNFTLELVSPILVFATHQQANECKREIVNKLHNIVKKKGVLLEKCLQEVQTLITTLWKQHKFTYWSEGSSQAVQSSNKFDIQYISLADLNSKLNFHNWDDTTELKKAKEDKRNIDTDKKLIEYLNKVGLSVSKKHGGIPSSQLNLPMSLKAYVWYSAYVKEPTAWRRLLLLSNGNFKKEQNEKRGGIIRDIKGNNVTVKPAFLNNSFTQKTKDWLKYWFWLVSIRELTELALKKININYTDSHTWRISVSKIKENFKNKKNSLNYENFQNLTQISNDPRYKGLPTAIADQVQKDNRQLPVNHYWTTANKQEDGVISSLLYLTVQKLIVGALGVLGEPAQLKLQEIVVDKEIEFKDLSLAEKEELLREVSQQQLNPEFRDYHSFLKDLTPLWFKGTLGDVMNTVRNTVHEQDLFNQIVENLRKGIESMTQEVVIKILNNNIKFLENVHESVQKDLQLDFQYKAISQTFIPNMDKFIEQYDKGRKELLKKLKLNDNSIWDLLTNYSIEGSKANNNSFLDRNNVPPWEGRWDTLKPPIGEGETTEFLVEHRNN